MQSLDAKVSPGQAARVLIVDDQSANIVLVHRILGGEWVTAAAMSGAQALASCLSAPPDLVLLDVHMPGMDGIETCRRLKDDRRTAAIPVIFVTWAGSPADEDACWNAGGADFVCKPIHPGTLRQRVRTQIRLRQQSDLLRRLGPEETPAGLAGRSHFDAAAADEWRRAGRSGAPVSLVMIDIDGVERYHDRYGPAAAARCLAAADAVLRQAAARRGDLAARRDGEEFVLLLPNTGPEGALGVARMAAARVHALALPHAGEAAGPSLRVCAGVASAYAARAGATLAGLVALAGRNLHRARQEGGAQVLGSVLAAR